jgi:hypothetical protein
MRLRTKYLHRNQQLRSIPAYLLPPVPQAVVFDPSLRRAGDIVAEAEKRDAA